MTGQNVLCLVNSSSHCSTCSWEESPYFPCSSKPLKTSLQSSENRLGYLKVKKKTKNQKAMISVTQHAYVWRPCIVTLANVCLSRKSLPFRGLSPPRWMWRYLGIYDHLKQAQWTGVSLLLLSVEFILKTADLDTQAGETPFSGVS